METLLAVLLYIGAISTNIEYTEAELFQIEAQNHSTVEQVETNPDQMDIADDIWDSASIIHIGDKIVIDDGLDW